MFLALRKKLKDLRGMITVEPCISFYLIGMFLSGLANQNLLLDKTCRVNLHIRDDLCDSLRRRDFADNSTKALDTEIQKYVSRLNYIGKPLQLAVPFCLVLLWGAWSDRHYLRKPLMLAPMIGYLVKDIALIICVLVKETNAEIVFAVENILPLLFGHWTIIVMGVFSHIMDSTKEETRTMKVAFSSIFIRVGSPIGSALSGVVLRELGYYGVFSISGILMASGIIYTTYCVEEVKLESYIKEEPQKKGSRKWELFLDWFNFKGLKTILTVMTRKREDKKRTMLYLGYLLLFFGMGPFFGEVAVNYLYTRHQFNYTEIEYSMFATACSIFGVAGLAILMYLNKKFFNFTDHPLAIIGLFFGIISSIVFALAKGSRDFYIAAAIDSGFSIFQIAIRAGLTKLVEVHEAAQSNALIGALESTIALIFATLYNLIYDLTVETYAGTFYFTTTVSYVIAIIVTWIWYRVYKSVVGASTAKLSCGTTIESGDKK